VTKRRVDESGAQRRAAAAERETSEEAPAKQRSTFWKRRHRLKVILLLVCAVTLTGATLALHRGGALERLELDTVDARFAVRGPRSPPKDVVVVAVDAVSFGELRRRFPWPRAFHAKLLRNLHRARVKAVIYDFQFTEPSAGDRAVVDAAGEARPVVFMTTETDGHGGTGVFGGDAATSASNLRRIGARVGSGVVPTDAGGVIRRMGYSRDGLRSLGIVGAEVVGGHRIPARTGETGTEWIDYAGPPGTIDTVSFSRVFNGEVDVDRLRGKVVVVGSTAPTLQDVHGTSAGGGLMSGAEIQANAFDTARRHFPLRNASSTVDTLLLMLMGLVAPLLTLRWSALRALPGVGVLAAGFLVATQVAFESGTVVAAVAPLLALVSAAVASVAVDYFTEVRARRFLRATFSRFVPDTIIDEIVDRGEARLSNDARPCTMMSCDLRDFTPFAEPRQAEDVIELLNHYLEAMSEAILGHGGTIVNIMGDGIIAVFGAPVEMRDHADRAVAAAREMLAIRLPDVNRWLNQKDVPGSPFRMGIGLSSGRVMSGIVGSDRRMEYAAVGDATIVASRLEKLTKESRHQLFVADTTRQAMTGGSAGLVQLDNTELRGRNANLMIWVPTPEWAAESHDPR
jgi:adenylate cyclase